MTAAELYFGQGRTTFTLVHPTGMTRTYHHFRDVADDTISARVYQGIHFRYADEMGAKTGREVTRYVEKTHSSQPGKPYLAVDCTEKACTRRPSPESR